MQEITRRILKSFFLENKVLKMLVIVFRRDAIKLTLHLNLGIMLIINLNIINF